MITIYDSAGSVLIATEVADSSEKRRVLMGDNYILLEFYSPTYISIPIGSYIMFGGKKFTILQLQLPDFAGAWKYSIKFDAMDGYLRQFVMFFRTSVDDANYDVTFPLTTDATGAVNLVLYNINAELGCTNWELGVIDSDLTNTVNLSFNGECLFDAMTMIAEALDTEWYITENNSKVQLNLGKCEVGTAVDFEEDALISNMERQGGDDSEYGTRFYIFGGTKNLPDDYDSEHTGVINSYTEKRLRLPNGQDYIDAVVVPAAQRIDKVVIFDDIYPINTDVITAVSAEEVDSTPVYTIIINDTPVRESNFIDDLDLMGTFETGSLAGMEFQLVPSASFDTDHTVSIQPINQGTSSSPSWIPRMGIAPAVGDRIILTNVTLPSARVTDASQRLLSAGQDYVEKHSIDTSIYNCQTNQVLIGENDYDIGQKVTLIDTHRFGANGRLSRIREYTKCVNNPLDVTYVVGDNRAYSRLDSIERGVSTSDQDLRDFYNKSVIDYKLNTKLDKEKFTKLFAEVVEDNETVGIRAKYDLIIAQTVGSIADLKNISEILRHLYLQEVDGVTYLGTDLNFFSEQDSAAGGIGSGAGGGGGTAYDRLDAWADYDVTKAGWVLSALLGNDLNTRLSAIESETMSLSSLTDVDTAGVANGKVLTYNSTTSKWSPQSVATSLATLTDVSISGVSDGQYLYYDSSAAKWKAKSLTSVFQMKGVVATIAELPTGSNIVGDVWHVAENGSEYVYLTSGWEELGTTIDLSGYLPKSAGSTQSLSGDLFVEGYKTGALTALASIAVISATRTSGTESYITFGDSSVVSHLLGSSIVADADISIIQSGTTLKNISEILRHLYLQTTDGVTYLGTDLNFFSEQDSAAGGIGSGTGGGGGTAYDRLDPASGSSASDWVFPTYSSDYDGYVLGAKLGYALNSRVGTIENNYTRPSGSGNLIKYLEVVSDYPATEIANTLYLKTGIIENSFTLTVFEWSEIGTYAGSESQDEVFSAYAFKQLYDIVQGFTGGEWGSVTANYVPLTIGEVTHNLSIDGHTHSQYALSSTLYNYITTNSAFSNFLSRSLASTGSGNAIVGLSVASDAVTGGYKLQATKGSVGTVTSVGISVPTGLAVSGSPITSSGTIAIALASGYSIPTTAKQTNWDTAYSNYHTHDNKSVLDGITSTKVGNWDTAFSNSHTHDNKSVLDEITSTKVSSWDTAYSNYHAHSSSYSFAANQITCNSIVIGGVTVSVVSGALKVTGNFAASGEVAAGA